MYLYCRVTYLPFVHRKTKLFMKLRLGRHSLNLRTTIACQFRALGFLREKYFGVKICAVFLRLTDDTYVKEKRDTVMLLLYFHVTNVSYLLLEVIKRSVYESQFHTKWITVFFLKEH